MRKWMHNNADTGTLDESTDKLLRVTKIRAEVVCQL